MLSLSPLHEHIKKKKKNLHVEQFSLKTNWQKNYKVNKETKAIKKDPHKVR